MNKEELLEKREAWGLTEQVNCSNKENVKYSIMLKQGEKLPDGVLQGGLLFKEKLSKLNGENDDVKTDKKSGDVIEVYAFYKYQDVSSDSERAEYLAYQQLEYLKSMHKGVTFLVVMTVLSLIVGIISGIISILPALSAAIG